MRLAGESLLGGWGQENVHRKCTGSVVGHNFKIEEFFPQKFCEVDSTIIKSNHIIYSSYKLTGKDPLMSHMDSLGRSRRNANDVVDMLVVFC